MYDPSNILYQPFSFSNITLPGRLVRSATELFQSEEDGCVSRLEIDHYRALARQPLGMVITAHSCVMPEGRSNIGQNAVWDDSFFEGQKQLCDIIHSSEFGTKIILQLGHGGMKSKANGGLKVFEPDNMTHDEINAVVSHYAAAALRAKEAGFDGIQIHAAHGYLYSEFFYLEMNHRTDEYGGSAENRFRIIMESAATIKAVCGEDFPVFLKIGVTDRPFSKENICSAQYFADLLTMLRLCGEVGIEGVEASGYNSSPPGKHEKPYFLDIAARRLAGSSPVPIMLVGGIRSMKDVSEAFDFGIATVSLCRPLLCDPDFAQTISLGAVSKCIGCNSCFADLMGHRVIRCRRDKTEDNGKGVGK